MATDIRTQELNNRLYSRNVPSCHLENWFTPTPTSTKFMRFPVVNCNDNTRKKVAAVFDPPTINVEKPVFKTSADFAPVTRTAPFRGFQVDVETNLRNQIYAAQKSDRAVWVPSSTSDLYMTGAAAGRSEEQTHPLLFSEPAGQYTTHVSPNLGVIGRDRFMNHTRTQLRGT